MADVINRLFGVSINVNVFIIYAYSTLKTHSFHLTYILG